jgi:hypothetical protein
LQADIIGLCETCVDWNSNRISRVIQQKLNQKFKINSFIGSKTQNNINKQCLPGGTLSITVKSMVHRICDSIKDPYHMGRWTGFQYNIGNKKRLYVITAYCVNDQQIQINNQLSSNSQQYYILQQRGITSIKPRRQFIIDFCELYEQICKDTDNYVILTLDANENLENPDKEGILELMEVCRLENIYQNKHHDTTQFPTHERGSKTIDFILGTSNIMEYVTNVGYIPFNECFDSNHRGIFCDLSEKLFNNKTINTFNKVRMVGSNSTNYEGKQYVTKLYQHLKNNNAFNKAKYLLDMAKRGVLDLNEAIKDVNKLDELLTLAMVRIERQTCKKKDPVLWTPAIKQTNLIIQYWNIKLKS